MAEISNRNSEHKAFQNIKQGRAEAVSPSKSYISKSKLLVQLNVFEKMSIMSICYLGEDDEILFFHSREENDEIASRFATYSTLNNIKKLIETNDKKGSEKKHDPYLGYVGVNLSLFSSYKNYAYVIKIINFKIILTVDDSKNKYTDDILKSIFIKLHKIYADTVCNPFYEEHLGNESFLKKISNSKVNRDIIAHLAKDVSFRLIRCINNTTV
ncbi:trafficking protein particle complex subunit 2-like protein, putative (TRAPPC2L) [Plasmodium ovale curtisi]|uniref:Trafficking protein particle complex subunit 2-like protein, putative (TRAPPC2L) n=1 Tax=Plasmodium ovale curtisi TaxID=864141 RepID=A0A1A8VTA5_PLAOA|nr:trafficking protein particle complex subunit 2-like protein, putative (TRAPPC2L) [Plasmodium ovale curtisi]SBS82567.1 trafficking protein particle complex subunit 2-like protein, putative (TRAPPC2L) [Plasmodium ovale curtisi]